MAISIDWKTRIISIPKDFLTLVQLTPIEIYELDMNTFRLALKALESDETGIVFIDTHSSNPAVEVGGVTLARVLEIINGYTVTFEDGSYAVTLVGGNNNVADKINFNLVSVRSTNSAGLIQTREIQDAAYNNQVYVDAINGSSGTLYPLGTAQRPVKTLADAILIAQLRGFKEIHIFNTLTITGADDIVGYFLEGDDPHNSGVILESGALIDGVTFNKLNVTGDLSAAGGIFNHCILDDITMFNGNCYDCVLLNTLYVVGGETVVFHNCNSGGDPTTNNMITLDCGGTGRNIEVRGFHGGIKLANKTGSDEVSLMMDAGCLSIANTVTTGTVRITGVSKIEENLGTATLINDGIVNADYFGEQFFAREVENGAGLVEVLRLISATLLGKVSGAGTTEITFRDVGDTKNRVVAVVDEDGNRTLVTLDSTP
jgi:hypothetical protein